MQHIDHNTYSSNTSTDEAGDVGTWVLICIILVLINVILAWL